MEPGDSFHWADALGVTAEELPQTLRPLVRDCRQLLNDTAKLRDRIHELPNRDLDLAFMAMERNLTFALEALGRAFADAGCEVNS